MRILLTLALAVGFAFADPNGYLVKLESNRGITQMAAEIGGDWEQLNQAWYHLRFPHNVSQSELRAKLTELVKNQDVLRIEKNNPIRLLKNPSILDPTFQAALKAIDLSTKRGPAYPDNPAIAPEPQLKSGADPLLSGSWGLFLIGATATWKTSKQGDGIIVAVTDTGVDYNHEDLINNMWRNPREVADDGIDNDENGFVDDVVGWDFVSNDNKPYDLSMSLSDILLGGGNPGHGTHVAGVIAPRLNNTLGTTGVAPKAKLMALRFLSEKGAGDTASAIRSIEYAVNNGAKIINASWGSEGEEAGDTALRDTILLAGEKGVLFVAAAGNGRLDPTTFSSKGYDNDTDAKPAFPASYPHANIVAVAAINAGGELAPFSNYGKVGVDLGAPGVKILSTVPGGRYQDTVIDLGSVKATWDGTSMAAPFVSGALAAVWSKNPNLTADQARELVLQNTEKLDALTGKTVTSGRLELKNLL